MSELIAALAGALVAGWGAWQLQRQKHVRRDRAIAQALLQNLFQMEGQLTPAELTDGVFRRFQHPPPTLHPWVEPLIVELAASDPRIVGACMQLGPAIAQLQATFNENWINRSRISDYVAELKRQRAAFATDPMRTPDPADTEAYLRTVERDFAETTNRLKGDAVYVSSLFAELRARLDPIAHARAVRLFPRLRSRTRVFMPRADP